MFLPKLFESQKPPPPPPASAGSLGGGRGFRGGGSHVQCPPAKGGRNPGVSFPSYFLPHSAPPPGDTRAFARDEGSLAVPTAHAYTGTPGTRPVRVASRIREWRVFRAGRVLGSGAQPLPTAPYRLREEAQGRGCGSPRPGPPTWGAGPAGAGVTPACVRPTPCPLSFWVCSSKRDSEASSPSTEIRAPPKPESGVFLPPLPRQSSLCSSCRQPPTPDFEILETKLVL